MTSAITPERVATASARLRTLAAEYGRTLPQVHVGLHAVLGDRPADRAAAARSRADRSVLASRYTGTPPVAAA